MKTAICTCIKDEQTYLKEWLDYHLDLGFDHIYLYEDFGSKSHNDLVNSYDNVTLLPMKVVMNEENHVEGRQMKSVRYSIKMLRGKFDWVTFIDADEFIRIEEGTLNDFLSKYEDYDGIYLSWRMFGACGHIEKPNCTVQEAYTTPSLNINYASFLGSTWLHKSFVNLNKEDSTMRDIHTVYNGINMDGGKEGKIGIYHTAWIDHYFTKSWEEWCDRIFKRGDLCNGNRRLHMFFKCNPDFNNRKDKMIAAVADRIPKGNKNHWLTPRIIAGGNVRKINELNKMCKL